MPPLVPEIRAGTMRIGPSSVNAARMFWRRDAEPAELLTSHLHRAVWNAASPVGAGTTMSDHINTVQGLQDAAVRASDPLRGALLDSRQRWHDLVAMAADIGFETDEWGRFVFLTPDPTLGWSVATLIGQPAELLLAGPAGCAGFNPFRPTALMRGRRVWLKRADGIPACLAFAAAPLFDREGRIVGARGMGIDMTEQEGHDAQVAAALRRGEVVDHILWRMRQEVLAPRMMVAVLDALVHALGAEGASVVDILGGGQGPVLLHGAGGGAQTVLLAAARLLCGDNGVPVQTIGPDGRPLIVCTCQTRFGEHAGLAIWRLPGVRPWDAEDLVLAASVAAIVRVVLEHEAIQREMARQARTDPLTGLLNRRAFLEELPRHIDRLDREELAGTLMFADLDNFKQLNDRMGHEIGDKALCLIATLMRDVVRPTDLVARLGGDEFALWLNGADHMTAAERAEHLRVEAPRQLVEITDGSGLSLGMSIGIAMRRAGGGEEVDSLIRRADMAMYEVKRSGRGHWRVAPEEIG
jgi:diguanylate cyclase (GGDEF)-like protein